MLVKFSIFVFISNYRIVFKSKHISHRPPCSPKIGVNHCCTGNMLVTCNLSIIKLANLVFGPGSPAYVLLIRFH